MTNPSSKKATKNYFLTENFAPTRETHELTPVRSVEGEPIPEALLGGMYVRNGPNPVTDFSGVGDKPYHWFDGDGMLHGVAFPSTHYATPHYVNKYVKTETYMAQTHLLKRAKPLLNSIGEFASCSMKFIIKTFIKIKLLENLALKDPVFTTANTSLVFHSKKLLATNEGGPPTQVTTPHLETVGLELFKDEKSQKPFWLKDPMTKNFTAHPKVCNKTGDMFVFGYRPNPAPYVHYSVIGADGVVKVPKLPIKELRAGFYHDFALTENYAVFIDSSTVFDIENLKSGKGSALFFNKELPVKLVIIPRYPTKDTKPIVITTKTSGSIIHVANAYETVSESNETTITLLACRADKIPDGLFEQDKFHSEELAFNSERRISSEELPRLHLWKVSLSTETLIEDRPIAVTPTQSLDTLLNKTINGGAEFPVINTTRSMVRNEFVYCARVHPFGAGTLFDGVVKYDLRNGGIKVYDCPKGIFCGEAVFVPKTASDSTEEIDEDDGYLLTMCSSYTKTKESESYLLILNAKDMTVLSKVMLGVNVPFGFHGVFLTKEMVLEEMKARQVLFGKDEKKQEGEKEENEEDDMNALIEKTKQLGVLSEEEYFQSIGFLRRKTFQFVSWI